MIGCTISHANFVSGERKSATSMRVGMSTSSVSCPSQRWCSWWYLRYETAIGTPYGRFATMPSMRFAHGRLCPNCARTHMY